MSHRCLALKKSSSVAKRVKWLLPEVDEALRRQMPPQLDMISAVKEFHVLSSEDLGKLITDAENGIIKWTKQNGSSFEISVESLARYLGTHIMEQLVSYKQDEQHFRYMLSGLKLLHTLYDIASHHSELEQVLFEDMNVGPKTLDLIFFMIIFLGHLGEKIHGSSQMVLLCSALLACSLYLLTAVISSEWQNIALVLLAHPKVNEFTTAAFTAIHAIITFLQVKLQAQHIDSHTESNVNEVYCLLHLSESSLQFLHSLFKQMLFREQLVTKKELCKGGGVLLLIQNTLKLSPFEDPQLMDVVYRLKSKVLSIMLLLCQVESQTFLDMASSTTQSLKLAESTVLEVLEVLNMVFSGDLKDHPRGILQLNAMRLTEIFSSHSTFRIDLVVNLTEALARVFSQPQREFLSTWCSNDGAPAEEDIIMEFDPISAAGQVLGLISTSQVRHSTRSNFQAPRTPYVHQKSSLLVKILANLTSFVLDLCEAGKALFINQFLECLQKEFSKLPGGAAEIKAAASRNLSSLLAHAESLTPQYLSVEDVHALGLFISQLEKLLAAPESDIHRIQGPEVTSSQLRNWLNNRKAKAPEAAKEAQAQSDGDDAPTEKQTGTGPDPISDSPGGLVLRTCSAQATQDTVAVPTSRFKYKGGQHVLLLDNHRQEIGNGNIHLASGAWFGRNLNDLSLCVVDVNEIKVPKTTALPHPTVAGSTFVQAELILGKFRILWDSSRLDLIDPATDAYMAD